jgi:hypothetical protein
MKGGRVIGAGGYGCVLRPHVTCSVPGRLNSNNQTKKLTKLLMPRDAEDERQENIRLKKIVKSMKNYEKYFIVDDVEVCTPRLLTNEDLVDFDRECNLFKNIGIRKQTINSNLHKLRILTFPDGGSDLTKSFKNLARQKLVFDNTAINSLLLDLLVNAIQPVNEKNFYHCDIKGPNVVYDSDKQEIKLIDWGMAYEERPFSKIDSIPYKFKRFDSFSYNFPTGTPLLSTYFENRYNNFLKMSNFSATDEDLFNFLVEHIYDGLTRNFHNHFYHINGIVNNKYIGSTKHQQKNTKFKHHKNFEYNTTINVIANHLLFLVKEFQIINKTTKKVSMLRYYKEKFLPDIDIVGFIAIYYDLLLESVPMKSPKTLNDIIYRYVYAPSIQPINVKNLVKELEQLITPQRSNYNHNYPRPTAYMKKVSREINAVPVVEAKKVSSRRNPLIYKAPTRRVPLYKAPIRKVPLYKAPTRKVSSMQTKIGKLHHPERAPPFAQQRVPPPAQRPFYNLRPRPNPTPPAQQQVPPPAQRPFYNLRPRPNPTPPKTKKKGFIQKVAARQKSRRRFNYF